MPLVTLEHPRILRDCTEGRAQVELDADRFGSAFEAIRNHWPVLATHVFAETGALRPHVLLLHNDQLTAREPRLDAPLAPGDRLAIVQAVSGG
jgi:molybdopterin synthase sulfur carrier subunit